MPDPIAIAIPVFFVLIALEIAWARRRRVRVHRFADAVTDLGCGVASQIALLAWGGAQLAVYAFVHAHARVFALTGPVAWLVAFVGVDALYYAWHRASHEVNLLWAAHAVHHQSEDYNLAVALRQAVLTSWTAVPFYLPLAVVGVPPAVFATVYALSTLYQFWIHTQLVRRGPRLVGAVLNMPAHHRVHHAVNRRYLDKNYGATLIVWDRLFGTFEDEHETPIYGVTKPLHSFDPLYAQIAPVVDLARAFFAARGPRAKLATLLSSPSRDLAGYDEAARAALPKHDVAPSRRTVVYVAVQYALLIVVTFGLMTWHRTLSTSVVVGGSLFVLLATFASAALLEGRRWARALEVGRWAVTAGAVALLVGGP